MTREVNLFSSLQESSTLKVQKPAESPLPFRPTVQKSKEQTPYQDVRTLIEAMLFASSEPLSLQRIREAIDPTLAIKPKSLEKILQTMKDEYELEKRGVRLVETAEGFLLKTPEELSAFLETVFKNRRGERLSQAAAEVLAIIVHRQPITRAQVESIRGVDCTGTIASLAERGLISSVGKADGPGRPGLWAVTPLFLTHFGLKDLSEFVDH